jgi:hydroxymethylbilane synthase
MHKVVRIATRKSALALWQARHVAALLKAADPNLEIELVPLTTQGDRLLDTPLALIGGKGLFLKELERAILDDEADIAVHSMKDVPAEMTPALTIGAVLERANPSDAWLSREGAAMHELKAGSVVGTSSLRRQSQLLEQRPDLRVESLRGNINTRLEKLDSGAYDAIILATAGLERLGLAEKITAELPASEWLPAPAQGAIGVECRADEAFIGALMAALDHSETRRVVAAERALSRRLGGSCQLPLAAYAQYESATALTLRALVGSSDGRKVLRSEVSGSADDPKTMADEAAELLLAQGADAIIRAELEMANQ